MKILFAAVLLVFVIGSVNASQKVTDEELSDAYRFIKDYGNKHSLRAMRLTEDGTFEGKKLTGEVLPIDLQLEPRILAEMQRRQALIMPELEKSVQAQAEYFREHGSFEPKSCNNSGCSFENDTCRMNPGCKSCWNTIPDTIGYCI